MVEVWQADHEGRYSGFRPFRARPGQIVTSASVPRDVVAPSETFLRGCQRTDDRGFCVFDTIYPGWYPSRTVHIHLTVQLGDRHAVTQLYFPDELTDQVFARPPYAGRPPRDTTNATDSIFVDGGESTMLHLVGDAADGLPACSAWPSSSTRRPRHRAHRGERLRWRDRPAPRDDRGARRGRRPAPPGEGGRLIGTCRTHGGRGSPHQCRVWIATARASRFRFSREAELPLFVQSDTSAATSAEGPMLRRLAAGDRSPVR